MIKKKIILVAALQLQITQYMEMLLFKQPSKSPNPPKCPALHIVTQLSSPYTYKQSNWSLCE